MIEYHEAALMPCPFCGSAARQEAAEMVVDAWNRRTTSVGEDISA